MRRSRPLGPLLVALSALAVVLLAYPLSIAASTSPPFGQDPVKAAWRRAQDSGVYRFSTTIVQKTHPAPTLANVGRTSREERTYLEGETNLPESTLQMTLWRNGGSVMKRGDGVELRIDGDRAQGREIGGLWHEIDADAAAFAPGNDLMAYLVGARNVRQEGTERPTSLGSESDRQVVRGTRYVFDLNGREVADYVRDQLEDHMREHGYLPSGLHLDSPDQFRDAIGAGKVWVDGDGLPMRLYVHIEYPQQRDGERVEADVETDFFNFDRRHLAAAERPLARVSRTLGLPRTAEEARRLGQQTGLALGTLGLLGFVVINRRSKAIYAAFILVIVSSMVVTPLLQSQHVHAFSERLAAERADQARYAEEQRQAEEAREGLYGSDWDPHRPSSERSLVRGESLSADSLSLVPARVSPAESRAQALDSGTAGPLQATSDGGDEQPDPDSDKDGDGLTYAQEERLGTDPDDVDTDNDQITDDAEVDGFTYDGRLWHLDPLNPDTNNDGQLDGVECPQQVPETEGSLSPRTAAGKVPACQNTDAAGEPVGDKVPDVFDRDNDGDGVPDRVDISPYRAMDNDGAAFDQQNPLLFQVDDLEADRPVFVDFQLRPENEDHLWYALNVLDWPSGDEHGQIQRKAGNDSTFADGADSDQASVPNADNGDMRLIPMLEIEIPFKEGHYGNLPVKSGAPVTRTDEITVGQWLDTGKLTPYGISVRAINNDGDLAAYVPLSLVQDETGGDRVAFSGRMHYWPTITTRHSSSATQTVDWGLAQQVRLIWMVQMLIDQKDQDGEWELDVPQVVRAYPGEWTLTGLGVQEDHGLDVAITYEVPENDAYLAYDDPLWAVASGLESSFLGGRDQNGNGVRDISIAEIDARFSFGSSATITERFGISTTIELETETYAFAHEGHVAHVMMTDTKQILEGVFSPYVDVGADAVTLLFSRETRDRAAGLGSSDGVVSIDGSMLTVDLNPDDVLVQTSAYLSWAPFRYAGGAWESYPIDEYLDRLEVRLKDVLDEYEDDERYEDILVGQLLLAKSYYLTLYRGLRELVEWGPDLTELADRMETDEELADRFSPAAIQQRGGLVAAWAGLMGKIFYKVGLYRIIFAGPHLKQGDIFAALGRWYKGQKAGAAKQWRTLGKYRLATGLLLVAGAVALFVAAGVLFYGETSKAIDFILKGLSAIWTTAGSLITLTKAVQLYQQIRRGVTTFKAKLGAFLKDSGLWIFLIIAVAVTWGVFLYRWLSSGAEAGSLAANAAAAATIAGTITTVLLFVLSAIPVVGQILTALIFLIDAIAMVICAATGSDNWFCSHGISGAISAGIGWFIYSANVMVRIDDEDRLSVPDFDQDFLDPDRGLTAGNSLIFSTTVRSSLELIHYWYDTHDWKAAAYKGQYSDETLESTTFDYKLQSGKSDIHANLHRGQISGDWEDDGRHRVVLEESAVRQVPIPTAGINQNASLYLAEGYALPVQECWSLGTIIPIPYCRVRTEKGTSHIYLGDNIYYDVFPASFDGFYDLVAEGGGQALSWSQDTELSFPRLKDADGDGLRNTVDDGADPDDTDWDCDDDGLSDFFELQIGTDPQDRDTDRDGLSDREEVILGSDPTRKDGDYDGLTDDLEVAGWDLVYGFSADGQQRRAWVTSDPSSIDADLDELTDLQEQVFGFHPQVPSDPHILKLESQVREENAPLLLLRLDETAHASAFRDDSGFANNGICAGDACPAAGHLGRHGNAPQFDGSAITADTVVESLVGSGGHALSFGGWVYPKSITGTQEGLFTFETKTGEDVFHLRFDPSSRKFLFHAPDLDADAESGPYATHQWHHVFAVIKDDASGQLYVDGDLERTFSTALRPAAGGRFSLGQAWDGDTASDFFFGLIDEALVFDRVLSEGEIEALMAGRYNPEDLVVRPGDPLFYQASVENQLLGRYAQGLLSTSFPVGFSEIPPVDFILQPQEEHVLTGTVRVAETATTGVYSLTQEVDAMIRNWYAASGEADMLLHLDEESGATTFADSSGNQPPRDGVCSGGSCPTAGEDGLYNRALRFDGADDFVSVEKANTDNPQVLTVAAWVNPDTLTSGEIQRFVTLNGEKAVLRYDGASGTRQLHFYMKIGGSLRSIRANDALEEDVWQFVTGTYDGNVMRLYLDGTQVGELTVAGDVTGEDGVRLSHPSESFHGLMDEVVIFPRALTPLQVQELYHRPVLHLAFDESGGATDFEDSSGFENDGSCAGSTCPGTSVEGVLGTALDFDGDDDAVRADGVANDVAGGAYSVGGFFRLTGDKGPHPTLFDFSTPGGWFRAELNATNYESRKAQLWYYDPGQDWRVYGDGWLEWDRWHHVMLVVEKDGDGHVYLDGEEVITFTTTTLPQSEDRFTVGHGPGYSTPFQGQIDEFVAYGFALSPEEVEALYQAGTTMLRLPLDDPPGVRLFEDTLGQHDVRCGAEGGSGDHCPTVGVAGRDNFALRFDGGADGAGDYVEAIEMASGELRALTIATWVKPLSLPSGEIMRFVTLGDDRAVLRYDGTQGVGQLHFYVKTEAAFHHLRLDGALDAGDWHHVAGAYDGAEMKLYLDGSLALTRTVEGNVASVDTILLSHENETLHGLLDEVAVYRRALSGEEVEALYRAPPEMLLTLDETGGDAFEDSSGNEHPGACSGDTCPGVGVKGQLGLAASFDGDDDRIDVAVDSEGNERLNPGDEMTLSAWVKLTDAAVDQKIVGKADGATRGYVLGVEDGQIYPEVWDSGSPATHYYTQCGVINAGYWAHLAMTWETGGQMVAYINGQEACHVGAGSNPVGHTSTSFPLRVGVAPWTFNGFPANGRIDHVTLYRRALSADEMHALFDLQSKWVEERDSTPITVDVDEPSSVLVSNDRYRPNRELLLLVTAEDPTSQAAMAALGVSTDDGTSFVWQGAPPCKDATGDAAWCPTFDPTDTGEGRYLLQTMAIDSVGNVETPSGYDEFLVDDTPPNPATAIAEGTILAATRMPTDTWLVPVSGAVSDPDILGTSEPGSGPAGVLVRLTAMAHPTDTLTPRAMAVDGNDWQGSFPLRYADASGTYTLSAQAIDAVGNTGPFIDLTTVRLDTRPPEVGLDPVPGPVTTTITSTLTLTGLVTETGTANTGVSAVEIGFLPGARADIDGLVTELHLDEASLPAPFFRNEAGSPTLVPCEGNTCPTAGAEGQWGYAADFDGDNDRLIVDGVGARLTSGALSFGAWVYPDGGGGVLLNFQPGGASGGGTLRIGWDGSRFYYSDGTPSVYSDWINAGQWYHVAVTTEEDGHGTLYVDGVSAATFETTVRPASDDDLCIGHLWMAASVAGHHFDGRIDEVFVYDRALGAEGIRDQYADTAPDSSGPGVLNTTWRYTLPDTLDGIYQINLRGVDVYDNQSRPSDWNTRWSGIIDTQAPRASMTVHEETSYLGVRTTYTCWARDFNLIWTSEAHPEYDFDCPCQELAPQATVYTPTYFHEVSPWYADTFTDTNRLYELVGRCTVPGAAPSGTAVQACDAHGHCRQATADLSESSIPDVTYSEVLTPTIHAVISTTTPISVAGRAYAGDYLSQLEFTADGAVIDTHMWPCPSNPNVVTQTTWASTWATVTEGVHTLDSHAVACGIDPDEQVFHRPVEVIVDATPPTLAITPTLLTTTHRLGQGVVALSGTVSDTLGIRAVQVSVDGGAWEDAWHYGEAWQLDWYLAKDPAGEPYTVTARAVDLAAHTTLVTETVTVDLVRPNPITLTLSADGQVVPPRSTLTAPLPVDLVLTWLTSTQRTDLVYDVSWTVYTDTGNVQRITQTPIPHTGPFTATYQADQAQRIVPKIVSRFDDGNRQADVYGSIYVDGPLTPDVITLAAAPGERRPYLGWMDSGCTQMGVDCRAEQNAPGSAAIDDQLELYVTWDSEALRMAWTGANWDYAGDLFIYLDTTAASAAATAYQEPFGGPGGGWIDFSSVGLPSLELFNDLFELGVGAVSFGPETLIWVEDSDTAHFLTWDPTDKEWQPTDLGWDGDLLSPDYYRFDEGLHNGHTDLYLPFSEDVLDIENPGSTPLALIAFATEESPEASPQPLSVWGTMPPMNLVNSGRVVDTLEFAPDDYSMGLPQVYAWDNLGPGVCPNNAFGDADVQVGLSADPSGASYGVLADDLFWLWEELPELPDISKLDDLQLPTTLGEVEALLDYVEELQEGLEELLAFDVSETLSFMDLAHPTVGDGDTISYTLHYVNRGRDTATDVEVYAIGLYGLRLGSGITEVISLGDLEPGQTGQLTFEGYVDVANAYNLCLQLNPHAACQEIPSLDPGLCDPFAQWDQLCQPFREQRVALVAMVRGGNGLMNPSDLLLVHHGVDTQPPVFFDIQQPELFVAPGENTLRGYAYDATGVGALSFHPAGGPVCVDSTPTDGLWSCSWNATTAYGTLPPDGHAFGLQVQAEDRHGYISDWTGPRTLIIDAVPPTVTFSAETTAAYSGTVVNGSTLNFTGLITDNHAIGGIEVCLRAEGGVEECGAANVQVTSLVSSTAMYTDAQSAAIPPCGGGGIARTFDVAADFTLGEVRLGINADHARRSDISATLTSPTGPSVQVLGPPAWLPPAEQNLDVLLYDAATAGLDDLAGDHDRDEPLFDHETRPYEPMRAFRGENAGGTWTLSICDTNPYTDDGTYNGAQLVLKPQNTAARSGRWTYSEANLDDLDGVPYTVTVVASDLVGNAADPISLTFEVDNVAPSLEISRAVALTVTTASRPPVDVLAGTAHDGGRIVKMYAFVESPLGHLSNMMIGRDDGDDWWFELTPDETGHYLVWVNARDEGSNSGRVGAFDVEVIAGPVANAGTDQSVGSGELVTLDGSRSYDDGDPLTYRWAQTGGVGVTLSDAATISPTFAAPWVSGPLTFTLTVTDTTSLSDTDTVVITVRNADLALDKQVTNYTPRSGEKLSYALTVTNAGPDDVVGLVISDLLPSGVTYLSDDSAAYDGSSGVWAVGVLTQGLTATLRITATVDAVTPGTLITNTAVITRSRLPDPSTDDHTALVAIAAQHPDAVIASVTSEGGGTLIYVSAQGYTTTVEIPAGAVSETITIILTPLDGPTYPTAPWAYAGHAFRLEAYRGPYLIPGYVFLAPVAVTIHYSDEDIAEIADEAELLIRTWAAGAWVDAACDGYLREFGENWLSTQICHLSEFALLGPHIRVAVGGETLAAAPLEVLSLPAALAITVMVLLLTLAAAVVRRRE